MRDSNCYDPQAYGKRVQPQLPSGSRTHPLEHPLPLDRVLVCRAQELAHPLHHGAQLGGARGRAVGLCVPQPRGDRLGLEGERVLRPPAPA